MPVAGEATFDVALDSLVAAIRAVEPHADQTAGRKGDDILARVRFRAELGELHVLATNGVTAALATVPIDPDSDSRTHAVAPEDDKVFVLDADPAEVRQVVARFVKGRSAKKGAPRRTLRLHWTDRVLRLTDVTEAQATLTGDMPDDDRGDLAELPARDLGILVGPPVADYPDVIGDVSKALAGIGETVEGKPLVTPWSVLGMFRGAAVAYGSELQIDATGAAASRGFVVTCGSWFAGTIPSRHADADSLTRRRRARMTLLHRLIGTELPDDLDVDDEVPPQVDDDVDERAEDAEQTEKLDIIGDGTDTPADEVTLRRRARRGRKDG